MDPWLETAGVLLLAVCGFVLSNLLQRQPKCWWVSGYCFSLAVVFLFGVQRYTRGLEFVPPFSWVASTRSQFFLFPLIVPMLILGPASKIPARRARVLLAIFAGLIVARFSVLPAVMPAFNRGLLSSLSTMIDVDGICLQRTAYTCGPAAAVTALRKLGLKGEEGQLAIWCRTTAINGTPPDVLAGVLNDHYAAQGLSATLRYFKDVTELKQAGLVLAVIKFDFFEDHFVTVLEASDKSVVVGDPLNGRMAYSYDDFAKIWRFSGVTVSRN